MKILLLFLLFLSIQPALFGQNKKELRELFYKAEILAYQQPTESIKISSYILNNTAEDYLHEVAYLLISQNNLLLGNYKEAIGNLFLSKNEELGTNDYKSNLLKSEIFRNFGFQNWSKTILDSLYPKIITQNNPKLQGDYFRERSFLLLEQKKIKPALKAIEKSISEYKKTSDYAQKELVITTCYHQFAAIYIKNGQPERAQDYIDSASNFRPLHNRTLLLQAQVLNEKKKYRKALATLRLLMPVSANVKEIFLRRDVYKTLGSSYYALKEIGNYKKFNTKYMELQDSIIGEQKKAQVILFSKVNEQKQKSINHERNIYYYIISSGIALSIIIAIIGLLYKRNLDIKYRNFQKLAANDKTLRRLPKTTKSTAPKNIAIPDSTMRVLLKKLKEFEKAEGYLDPKISLITLAKKMDTNTKYLSEIINTHKQNNFHTYINELRINYIIQKLKTNKQYLKYKVSYLAKESGFLSHSTFATTFKNIVGISPSSFIKLLKKDVSKRKV